MTSTNVKQNQRQIKSFEWTLHNPLSVLAKDFRDSPTFLFSGRSWCLRVHPRGGNGYLSLYLKTEKCDPDVSIYIICLFTLEKEDGHITASSSGKVNNDNLCLGWSAFTKNNAKGIPFNYWTMTCCIMSAELEKVPQPMSFNKLITLSTNFKELFISGNHCDVTIKVEDSEFQAHKAILAARSPVLAAAFEHDMLEKQTGVITIEDCCPDSFKLFLLYLYSGTIENFSWRNIYHLYIIADKYNEKDLKSFCVSYFVMNLTVENVCDALKLADQCDETELMSSAQTFFVQNFKEIMFGTEWEKLMKDNYRFANKLLKYVALNAETNMKNDEPQ